MKIQFNSLGNTLYRVKSVLKEVAEKERVKILPTTSVIDSTGYYAGLMDGSGFTPSAAERIHNIVEYIRSMRIMIHNDPEFAERFRMVSSIPILQPCCWENPSVRPQDFSWAGLTISEQLQESRWHLGKFSMFACVFPPELKHDENKIGLVPALQFIKSVFLELSANFGLKQENIRARIAGPHAIPLLSVVPEKVLRKMPAELIEEAKSKNLFDLSGNKFLQILSQLLQYYGFNVSAMTQSEMINDETIQTIVGVSRKNPLLNARVEFQYYDEVVHAWYEIGVMEIIRLLLGSLATPYHNYMDRFMPEKLSAGSLAGIYEKLMTGEFSFLEQPKLLRDFSNIKADLDSGFGAEIAFGPERIAACCEERMNQGQVVDIQKIGQIGVINKFLAKKLGFDNYREMPDDELKLGIIRCSNFIYTAVYTAIDLLKEQNLSISDHRGFKNMLNGAIDTLREIRKLTPNFEISHKSERENILELINACFNLYNEDQTTKPLGNLSLEEIKEAILKHLIFEKGLLDREEWEINAEQKKNISNALSHALNYDKSLMMQVIMGTPNSSYEVFLEKLNETGLANKNILDDFSPDFTKDLFILLKENFYKQAKSFEKKQFERDLTWLLLEHGVVLNKLNEDTFVKLTISNFVGRFANVKSKNREKIVEVKSAKTPTTEVTRSRHYCGEIVNQKNLVSILTQAYLAQGCNEVHCVFLSNYEGLEEGKYFNTAHNAPNIVAKSLGAFPTKDDYQKENDAFICKPRSFWVSPNPLKSISMIFPNKTIHHSYNLANAYYGLGNQTIRDVSHEHTGNVNFSYACHGLRESVDKDYDYYNNFKFPIIFADDMDSEVGKVRYCQLSKYSGGHKGILGMKNMYENSADPFIILIGSGPKGNNGKISKRDLATRDFTKEEKWKIQRVTDELIRPLLVELMKEIEPYLEKDDKKRKKRYNSMLLNRVGQLVMSEHNWNKVLFDGLTDTLKK